MTLKHVPSRVLLLSAILLITDSIGIVGRSPGAADLGLAPTASLGGNTQRRRMVDAGEFYRVGERKIRLLRSLEKIAIRHGPDRGQTLRRNLERRPLWSTGRLRADKELARERLLILQAPNVTSLGGLRETMDRLHLEADVNQVLPVYVNEESGLEVIVTDRFVVKLAAQSTTADLETINRRMGVVMVRPLRGTPDQFILSLPGGTPEELFDAVELYGADPAIEWASPSFLCQFVPYAIPNDPYYLRQWHLNNTGQSGGTPDADVDAAEAWDLTTGSSQVTIAVLDDGMDLAHEDLKDNLWTNSGEIPNNGVDDDNNGYVDDRHGWDFFNHHGNPSHVGSDSHGTAVAGVAVATGNNSKGVAGVAYGCKVMPVKYGQGNEGFWDTDVADAIRYAAGVDKTGRHVWRGADVINISGGLSDTNPISSALHDAFVNGRNGKGCPIFCAVGNDASGWQGPLVIPFQSGPWSNVTFRWEYRKDSSGSAGDDTVWLDTVTFPDGTSQSFEQGLPTSWRTGGSGNVGWAAVQDGAGGNHAMSGYDGGSRALRAGAVGNNGYSYVEVTRGFTVPAAGGSLSFYFWPSCPQGDGLRFIIKVGANEYVYPQDGTLFSGVPSVQTVIAYPASHPDTMAVGSSTNFDYRADHSRYGAALDFLAPGGGGSADIWTTAPTGTGDTDGDGKPDGNYRAARGTSVASPLAAAVAALMLSKDPNLPAQRVRQIMRSSCDKIGGPAYDATGRNDYYGYGRINAKKALDATGFAGPSPQLPSDLAEVVGASYASTDGLASGSKEAQDQQEQAVQQLKLPLEVKTKQTGIVLRLIPDGIFTMGSPASEAGRESDEGPQHQVKLTNAFYCGKFEITQEQWQEVMGSNPSYFRHLGPEGPVEQVSWDDCQDFLKKLCAREGVPEGTYRLLTEAEWEYACRAGTTTAYCFGDDESLLSEYAWYKNNSFVAGRITTHWVGMKKPNALGLYDMYGNVRQWCQDWYSPSYYSGSPANDPLGPPSGDDRIARGGIYIVASAGCRSAVRSKSTPSLRSSYLGLRIARTTESSATGEILLPGPN